MLWVSGKHLTWLSTNHAYQDITGTSGSHIWQFFKNWFLVHFYALYSGSTNLYHRQPYPSSYNYQHFSYFTEKIKIIAYEVYHLSLYCSLGPAFLVVLRVLSLPYYRIPPQFSPYFSLPFPLPKFHCLSKNEEYREYRPNVKSIDPALILLPMRKPLTFCDHQVVIPTLEIWASRCPGNLLSNSLVRL